MKRWGPKRGMLVVALLLMPLAATAADPAAAASEVSRINGVVSQIDQSLSNTADQTKVFTKGNDSGILSLYHAGNGFSKLVVQLVSNEAGDVSEYYFSNGSLLYVVEVCKNFTSTPHSGSINECSTISEDRYYLASGTLIEWLTGTGPGPVELHPAAADPQSRRTKARQVLRSAENWRSFASSPLTDFGAFEKARHD